MTIFFFAPLVLLHILVIFPAILGGPSELTVEKSRNVSFAHSDSGGQGRVRREIQVRRTRIDEFFFSPLLSSIYFLRFSVALVD